MSEELRVRSGCESEEWVRVGRLYKCRVRVRSGCK